MKINYRYKFIFLFLMGLGTLSINSFAQTKDSLQHRIDSLRNESEKYVIDTSVSLVIKKTEAVTQIINNIKEILRRGFDTSTLETALPETEMYIQNIQANYQQNQQLLNLRNLNIIKSILFNYSQQLKKWQEMLIGYTTEMMQINSKLNLIIRDSTFSYLPHDTLISNTYKTQLLIFTEKWGKADSSNKKIYGMIMFYSFVQLCEAYIYYFGKDETKLASKLLLINLGLQGLVYFILISYFGLNY